ncbi:thioredoxin family protein [Maricaulis sp.]|uniref:thioredoxin family protein n=1 Tax=Maricaulis sp. TaxID=1486257 RepID=UPI00262C6227|nr:thioredoxin family protein [Maricaulis sp.]
MRLLALASLVLILFTPLVHADDAHPRPYDGNFDAMAVVDEALEEARAGNKRLVLILGANWCHDSRGLAHHLEDEEVATILAEHYVLRHIDVGWRDQNHAVMRRFNIPAVYGTPTVFIIDAQSEDLLNRETRSDWTSAASRPVEDVRAYFADWASNASPPLSVVESSLVYQSMLIEIDLFEDEEAERLAQAYIEIGAWRDGPRDQRPDNFATLAREVDLWRLALPQRIRDLREQALSQIEAALSERAGGGEITLGLVSAFDASDPDLTLELTPTENERW